MIGAVTDDFTGAASAGVLIARSQARTGLFLDAEALEDSDEARCLDAVFVSSNSRHLKPEDAYREVCRATKALKSAGVTCFSKKIDTTLRGRIGNEIDAMMDTLGGDMVAVMVPAMPQSRRICLNGISIIDGTVLTETPIAQDVKTPVKDAFVPRLIQGQSRRKVELISIENVDRGKGTLKCAMIDARERGGQILVMDAVTMEHIDLIAQACVELGWNVLAVDPGAFTMKLNYRRGMIKEEASTGSEGSTGPEDEAGPENEAKPEEEIKPGEKVALFVVGSANPLTKAQMKYLCSSEANVPVHVSAYMLISGQVQFEKEVNRAVGMVVNLFRQKPRPQSIIIGTALQDCVVDLNDEDLRRGYDSGTCSRLINEGLAEITGRVIELAGREQVAGLLLTGGDTMESVCRRLHVSYIEAIDHIVAQVDVGRIMGNYTGLPVVVKGGFCGSREIGMAVVRRLLSESAGCREENGIV